MERFWNTVHYFAYRADYKLHMAYYKIDPGALLVRLVFIIPFIRKAYLRKGVTQETIDKRVDEAFKRTDYGFSTMYAGILMTGLLIVLCFVIHLLILEWLINDRGWSPEYKVFVYPVPVYSTLSYAFNHLLLFRKDKYLRYFKEFDKKPREWKVKWAWISFGVILFPFVVLALSLVAMSK
jgi:hypothetical protein